MSSRDGTSDHVSRRALRRQYRMSIASYIWAAPNSLIGLSVVPIVALTHGRLEVVDGVLEVHGPFIARMLRRCVLMRGGAAAITFGHVVLGRDQQALSMTRAHERVHVRQYELWGPAFIPVYLLASVWGLMTGSGAYYGNVFERAAMRVDRPDVAQ